MGRTAISNREKRLRRKLVPKEPRTPKAEGVVRVAAAPANSNAEPTDRDGLMWLAKKKRISAAQAMEGLRYRALYRQLTPGGSIKSCLDDSAGLGGGKGGGLPFGGSYGDAAAQLELFVIRSLTLRSQTDLLTVMDGVCGLGHTVRFLAGGDQLRATQLEAALRIALDMLISDRLEKEAAKEKLRMTN